MIRLVLLFVTTGAALLVAVTLIVGIAWSGGNSRADRHWYRLRLGCLEPPMGTDES
jgi:hypothetical protein